MIELKNKIGVHLELEEPICFYHISNGIRAEIFDFEYIEALDENDFVTVLGKGQRIKRKKGNDSTPS